MQLRCEIFKIYFSICVTMGDIEFEKEILEVIHDSDSDEELEDQIDFDQPESEEEAVPEEVVIGFRSKRPGDSGNRLNFTPKYVGINKTAAPNIKANSSPFSIFILFFEEVLRILVMETNRYFQQYCDGRDVPGPSTQSSNVTFEEMYKFLALLINMGHDQRDLLKDYWRKDEQFHTPFYSNTMVRDRFLHILRFLHFTDNNDAPNKEDPKYDRLWKLRKVFDSLNNKFSELYYPTEHLAVDEVIVKFKGKVIFRQYIPKKHKRFGVKIYKLNDSLGYTYDMNVYLGKQKELATDNVSAIHGTVLQLIRRVEGVGHKLFMDNHFSSPILFDDLLERKINSCGTVRYNRRGLPQEINPKQLKLRRGDIVTRVRGNLCVLRWKDKRDVFLLTNMHSPPAEGNFVDEHYNAIKPQVIEDYNKHMGYVDKADRMANSYGISRRTWKWTKKLFFHLLDITILNSFLLHKTAGGKMSHKTFRETLVRDLICEAHQTSSLRLTSGRPSSVSKHLLRLEAKNSQHWPSKCKMRRCRVCSAKNKFVRSSYCCEKCNVGLCVVDCFKKWHTQVNF